MLDYIMLLLCTSIYKSALLSNIIFTGVHYGIYWGILLKPLGRSLKPIVFNPPILIFPVTLELSNITSIP